MKTSTIVLLALIVTILLAASPAVLTVYWQTVLVGFVINVLLIMGYRVITTMGGWSFAHVAVMGLGAYTMALLTTAQPAWSFWTSTFAAVVVTALFALVLAYPVLRTRAYYFFLSTFAASEALRQCFIQFSWITGGTNGIAFVPRPAPLFGISFETIHGFLYLVLAITLLVGCALLLFDRSRVGYTIKAVAANEDLSTSLGMNAWAYRTLAFVIGSAIAGLAGALSGNFNGIINPSAVRSIAMFKLVAAAIVGGTTTFFGPVLGLIYLTALEELFRAHASWVPLLWGASVVAAILLTKGGIETIFIRPTGTRRADRNKAAEVKNA